MADRNQLSQLFIDFLNKTTFCGRQCQFFGYFPVMANKKSSLPKIIDLFAGAGGLSLGAARSGFDVAAAVELDKFALETHKKNFPSSIHLQNDVSKLDGNELLQLSGLKKGELEGLIGGPPCQGFSTMGKRQVSDPRNNLFTHFFRLVKETSPAFFVAENVTGILDKQYNNIRRNAFALLGNDYILLDPIRIKASEFGAPTIRTRIFFIGFNPKKIKSLLTPKNFLPSDTVEQVLVKEALQGLPINIAAEWLSEESGWRKINRNALGKKRYFNLVTNSVPLGVGNPKLIERYFEKDTVSGCMGTRHTPEVTDRYAALKYGEQDSVSKAVKLNPEGFCPTLRAGTGSDKGSFQAVRPIHYRKPRVITPREAARLQGFPDWFVFHPTKWHSFRQIGNSVSPIVAEQVLSVLRSRF
jgi:DNA (cytosine-5)-methyltransferase 1